MAEKDALLIEAIVCLADEQLGGERSRVARYLFRDIAAEARASGHVKLARIADGVADHYDY